LLLQQLLLSTNMAGSELPAAVQVEISRSLLSQLLLLLLELNPNCPAAAAHPSPAVAGDEVPVAVQIR
jgi:hypothetical protein